MACGTPVISTRCGGPEEFVTPDTGIIIEPGDPSILKKAVEKGLRKQWNRKKISDCSKKFTQEKVIEKTIDFYREAEGI